MYFKYENLKEQILNYSNVYEEINAIKTKEVYEVLKDEDVALWLGDKTDGSKTIFLVFRVSRRYNLWNFLTPTHNQIQFFKNILPGDYCKTDNKNSTVSRYSK